MAGGGVAEPSASQEKRKKGRGKRRIGILLDMTPMVDIAFLLLTFFMLTTVFSMPQTMEINLPPDEDVTVDVKQSELLTLRIMEDSRIFAAWGVDPATEVPKRELPKYLTDSLRDKPKMITLVKVDRRAKYSDMVDIMDELNLAKINRFSMAPMLEFDVQEVQKVGWVPMVGGGA